MLCFYVVEHVLDLVVERIEFDFHCVVLYALGCYDRCIRVAVEDVVDAFTNEREDVRMVGWIRDEQAAVLLYLAENGVVLDESEVLVVAEARVVEKVLPDEVVREVFFVYRGRAYFREAFREDMFHFSVIEVFECDGVVMRIDDHHPCEMRAVILVCRCACFHPYDGAESGDFAFFLRNFSVDCVVWRDRYSALVKVVVFKDDVAFFIHSFGYVFSFFR